jgi:hypothetical protein
MRKDGFAKLNLFLNRQNTFIRRSMLDVRCSTFISFFFDLTGRPPEAGNFFWPAAGLNLEPVNGFKP